MRRGRSHRDLSLPLHSASAEPLARSASEGYPGIPFMLGSRANQARPQSHFHINLNNNSASSLRNFSRVSGRPPPRAHPSPYPPPHVEPYLPQEGLSQRLASQRSTASLESHTSISSRSSFQADDTGVAMPVDGQPLPVLDSRSQSWASAISKSLQAHDQSGTHVPSIVVERADGLCDASVKATSSVYQTSSPGTAVPAGRAAPSDSRITGSPEFLFHPITTAPVSASRYFGRGRVDREPCMSHVIAPMKMSYDGDVIPGWDTCLHPEGDVYFFNPVKSIFTRANLYDRVVLLAVEGFAEAIELTPGYNELPGGTACVLHVESSVECGYYLVHPHKRVIFWMDEFQADELFAEVDGVCSETHLKHEIEYHYWTHLEMFPYRHQVSRTVVRELIEIMAKFGVDTSTSMKSTSPYENGDLKSMLGYLRDVTFDDPIGEAGVFVVGRLMATFAHERFLNFAGQIEARLNSDQCIYQDSLAITSHSGLFQLISFLLFMAPSAQVKALERVWVDMMVNQVAWRRQINKLQNEWKEFIFFSTVMLTANTALLAVPSVDGGLQPYTNRTPVQLLSYVSVASSVASIMLGFMLSRQYRRHAQETAKGAAVHLSRRTHPQRGVEGLAIVYSLPFACSMWSMVSFLGAFAAMCFRETGTVTRAICTILLGLVFVLVGFCIVGGWEQEQHPWYRGDDDDFQIAHIIGGAVEGLVTRAGMLPRAALTGMGQQAVDRLESLSLPP